jgi:hypothetical protein
LSYAIALSSKKFKVIALSGYLSEAVFEKDYRKMICQN